ncbi:unnamed protein product [Linum trigynum]|uniref:Uncharacterized protein n=1 Tax=Linum trigynum TaxID=586398 RepID=A0AAV2GC36_9ROSI
MITPGSSALASGDGSIREEPSVKLDFPRSHFEKSQLLRSPPKRFIVPPKMEAVDGLVSIPFLLCDMLDWHADLGGDPQPLVEVADAEFVRERDQVTDRELPSSNVRFQG